MNVFLVNRRTLILERFVEGCALERSIALSNCDREVHENQTLDGDNLFSPGKAKGLWN